MLPKRVYARRTPELEAAICALLAGGGSWSLAETLPGFPSRPTIRAWARQSPDFARRMAQARADGRARKADAWHDAYLFRPLDAQAFINRVRMGAPIHDLIRRTPRMNRRILNSWKHQSPWFAHELARAVAAWPGKRPRPRRPYDEAVADQIMLRVSRGETLPNLYKDPTLATRKTVREWRRLQPDFDSALRAAAKRGHRARSAARSSANCTPELIDEIGLRIFEGASLASLGLEPDMPSRFTLYKWVRTQPAFAAEVARACEWRDMMLVDELSGRGLATANAAMKRLGQLNPHPGQRQRR